MSPVVADCPECAGSWLNGWRWQHTPGACPLGAAQDATAAADTTRMATTNATYWRVPTPAEITLHTAVTGAVPTVTTAVVPYATGINAVFINNNPSAALRIDH